MPTSYETERTTLDSYFNTQWGQTTPIAWQGSTYEPREQDEWVRPAVVPIDAYQADLAASPRYRFEGFYVIDVFTPRNQGPKRNEQLCDLIVADFRGVTTGGVTMRNSQSSAPEKVAGTDTTWFHQQIRVPFYWDVTP